MGRPFIHHNGGGKILDPDSHVSVDSTLDVDSVLEGYCSVVCNSRVRDSRISASIISSGTIVGSVLYDAQVFNGLVAKCGLRSVHVRSESGYSPQLLEVVLEGVTVAGPTILHGPWTMRGPFLIHAGEWHAPPRHHHFQPNGAGALPSLGIIECLDGKAHIGCVCRPIAEWCQKKELLRRIFVRRGWQPEFIDQIATLFDSWQAKEN